VTNWWVLTAFDLGGPILLVSWIFWVIFSITLHELAHGWAALWQGDDTPRVMQRMTANPIVHMGPMSLIVFAILGIAWGLMPVDPSKFRWRRRGRIVVAAAGPAMNIALAVVTLTAAGIWQSFGPGTQPLQDNIGTFLFTGGWLNLALAIFNLLPLPPLDGFQMLVGASFRIYRLAQHPNLPLIALFVIMVIFISGIGSMFFVAAMVVASLYYEVLLIVLP
jgi:Zn-dependent protease